MEKKWIGLALLTVSLLSCRGVIPTPQGGAVRIGVSFGSDAARTVVPDLEAAVDEIQVTLTSNDGLASRTDTDTDEPWGFTFDDVAVGSWDIGVVVLSGGVQIGAGSVEGQTLAEGSALLVTVPVVFDAPSADGDASFTVSFADSLGIDYVRGVIEETGAESVPTLTSGGGLYRALLVFSDLPAETYSMVLTFRRGGPGGACAGVFREKVIVWNGFVSDRWVDADGQLQAERAFAAEEFLQNDTSLALLAVEGVLAEQDPPTTTTYGQGPIAGLTEVTFTVTGAVDGQYIEYRWNDEDLTEIRPGVESTPLEVEEENELEILVTAPDRLTITTYTVTFVRGYTVTYASTQHTGGSVPTDTTAYASGDPDVPVAGPGTLSRAGYDFAGWRDGGGTPYLAGSTFTMGSANVVLYAQWSATVYDITYVLDGGTNAAGNPAQYTIESDAIVLEDPDRDEYVFAGWYAEPGFVTEVTEITTGSWGDRTLYARWLPENPIVVVLDLPPASTIEFEGVTDVPKGTDLEVSVTGTYVGYQWYLDGDLLAGEVTDSVVIPTTTLDVGLHQVSVVAVDDEGTASSGTLNVRVTN